MDLVLIIALLIFLAVKNARDDKRINWFDYTSEAEKMRQKTGTSKTDDYRNLY